MKVKIESLYGMWTTSTAYIFLTLYTQLAGVFIPISITKIYVLLLVFSIIYGLFKKKIKGSIMTLFVAIGGVLFLILYYLKSKEIFSYAYPGVITLLYAMLCADNQDMVKKRVNIKLVNKLITGYLFINILLYLARIQAVLQINQFKGALPHTNMLGAVLFAFFVMIFWDASKLGYINKVLITIIMLLTQSRTYLLMIIALWLLILATQCWKKVNIVVKIIIGGLFLGLFGGVVFESMISHIPGLSRFSTFGFTGNGRQILQTAYVSTIRNSSMLDMIQGYPMAMKYMSLINVDFYHSFTENSYAGYFLMFGVFGFGCLVVTIVKMFKKSMSVQNSLILLFVLVSFYVQDTMLSVQTGIMIMYGLSVANSCTNKKGGNTRKHNNIQGLQEIGLL